MPRTYDTIKLSTSRGYYHYPFTLEGLTLAYNQLQNDFNPYKTYATNWDDISIKGFRFENDIRIDKEHIFDNTILYVEYDDEINENRKWTNLTDIIKKKGLEFD